MPSQPSLVDSFVAQLDEDSRAQAARTSNLGLVLRELVESATASWPEFHIAPAHFVGYVAERLPGVGEVVAELRGVRGSDLYLACACTSGSSVALASFDKHHGGVIGAALGRMNVPESTKDEVRQLVRQKLFVTEGDRLPRIADYVGRGDIRNWVRATAVRTCLNLLRKYKREVALDDERMFAAFPADDDDPELAHMKELYRDEFKKAFADALRSLEPRPQNLLRHYYVDELTIDDIGGIYRVHRVTAFRWINKAREQLVEETHAKLKQRLNITQNEMDSILRLIRSELDLSIARYLDEDA